MFFLENSDKMQLSFLARRDEYSESYCRTPGVGVVGVRVHKIFNHAHDSLTTIDTVSINHMCIPWDKTFPWTPNFFLSSSLDLEF